MLTDRDVKELLNVKTNHPVLSVYLNVDSTQQPTDAYKLRLRGMLKDLATNGSAADAAAVERFMEHEYDWTGRSLAIFSCAPAGFFRAYSLQIPVRSRARLMPEPYVKPLADLLDSFGGYGVALVDKQGVRVFHFHLGELREQEGSMGEAIKHIKRGGASTAARQRGGVGGGRHSEEMVARNMRESAAFAAGFFTQKQVRRILLGGTEANLARFRAELPRSLQSLVMGSFPMEMTASHDEVMRKAMQVAEEAERKREARLVQAVITAAAKGREGVVGLEDTLGAVHEGRVMTLAVSEGYRAPGYRCAGCGYVTAQVLSACPFCSQPF
ncbi:MAG: hypothetical protein HY784_14095, partial [Chloroflexi bacterium]|nr:hypothetical protein [Chloroflexota bacterium]